MGYIVSHVQTPLDEFDYAVTNLRSDLRDGLRLGSVCVKCSVDCIFLCSTTSGKPLCWTPLLVEDRKSANVYLDYNLLHTQVHAAIAECQLLCMLVPFFSLFSM